MANELLCKFLFKISHFLAVSFLQSESGSHLIHSIIPLHQLSQLSQLQNSWVFASPSEVLSPPIGQIREYFGPEIALYFAWLSYFTIWLIVPAVIGKVKDSTIFAWHFQALGCSSNNFFPPPIHRNSWLLWCLPYSMPFGQLAFSAVGNINKGKWPANGLMLDQQNQKNWRKNEIETQIILLFLSIFLA